MTRVQVIMLIVAPPVAFVIALVCLFTGQLRAAPLGFLAFVLLTILAAMLLTTRRSSADSIDSRLDAPHDQSDEPTVTTGGQAPEGQKR